MAAAHAAGHSFLKGFLKMGFYAQIISGVLKAGQTYQAGRVQKAELQAQAKTELIASQSDAIERRRALIRALATQNASAGAEGIELGGSVGAIMRRDIKDASNDLLVNDANSRMRQSLRLMQGRAALKAGKIGAATSLLDSVASAYGSSGGG
jgi:hypothetical protein